MMTIISITNGENVSAFSSTLCNISFKILPISGCIRIFNVNRSGTGVKKTPAQQSWPRKAGFLYLLKQQFSFSLEHKY